MVVIVLAVAGYLGWLGYTFVYGTAASKETVARAQAQVDVLFPDYPVKVVKVRHMSFVKDWDEVTLAPVDSPNVRVTISPWTGPSSLATARQQLKIKRDGQIGVMARSLNPTPGRSVKDSWWTISGRAPEADFSTHDPYDWSKETIGLAVYSASSDLSDGDAAMVGEGLAAVGDHRDRLLSVSVYPRVRVTGDPPYYYSLTPAAASSATLPEDFARVAAGEIVPGIERRPR